MPCRYRSRAESLRANSFSYNEKFPLRFQKKRATIYKNLIDYDRKSGIRSTLSCVIGNSAEFSIAQEDAQLAEMEFALQAPLARREEES